MANHKVQFCPKGHDTFICGRGKDRACKDCKRDWGLQNPEYFENYLEENREELTKYKRQWHLLHIDSVRASKIKSQTNRNLRVVAWTDWDNIIEFYDKRPDDKVGDHYIPLIGKKVSGLHVSWNLQYLTPEANRLKHNNIDLVEVSEWYGCLLKEAGLK